MALNRRSRILLASAMPEAPPLDGGGGRGRLFHAGSKVRALVHRLRPLIEHGEVSLVVEPAVRADHLARLLRAHRPHILHIVCHGTTRADGVRALVLEDRRGTGKLLDAYALSRTFAEASHAPALLIAEACGSLPIVDDLVESRAIPAAIGVRDSIDPQASTRFFVTLHAALASGCTVREAFADARRDLELLAPSIWELPVLREGDSTREPRAVLGTPEPDDLEIDPTRADDLVLVSTSLGHPSACFGRDDELARLDQAWASDITTIVHLRGVVGMGKTTLLSHWLADLSRRRFRGASRVLAWSFDPRARGAGCGDVDEFLEQALDFFGALEPTLIATRHDADDHGQWLDGLRLGRCLRHQRALLCLDAVPLLPHGEATALPPQRLLPPALAALLLELSRGSLATCVLSTRAAARLSLPRVEDLELGPLHEDAVVELLAQRGVLARRDAWVQLASTCGGHPGRLAIAGDAAKVTTAWGPRALLSSPQAVLEQIGDDALVEGVVAGGGWLRLDELRVVMERDEAPGCEPAWGGLSEAKLQALCRARSMGVVRLTEDGEVALSEDTWFEHVVPSATTYALLFQQPSRRITSPLQRANQAPTYREAVRTAVLGGAPECAVEIYVELVCRLGRDRYEQSYLARKLGAVAEELSIASELFEPSPGGEFVGKTLRPGVAEADPPGGAFLFHRVGLALRHLGSLHEAVAPLVRAFELYDEAGAGYEERAATCANDLAEVHILRDEPETALALQWAEKAVACADRAERGGVPAKQALLAQFLCHATLGYVHHRRGQVTMAAAEFQRAEESVQQYCKDDSEPLRWLYSRPGHQQWCFLLERLADDLALASHGEEVAATISSSIEELLARFRWAEGWASGRQIARVTRSYHHLARGRLALLVHERQPPPEQDVSWLHLAQRDLFAAVHILRANQHLWMLPDALEARAELFKALKDPVSAELDREEASWLEAQLRA